MATIKKASKGTFSPKSSSVSKRLGSYGKKMKSGGSFPDLNKDGKVTKKDVLIGRGVLPKTAKKGVKVKKAQTGASQVQTQQGQAATKRASEELTKTMPTYAKKGATVKKTMKSGGKMTKKCRYGCK